MSAEFNPEKDISDLYKAFPGQETDNATIISIIAHRTYQQRQEIAKRYKEKYNEDLQKRLRDELSGGFKDVAIALFDPPAVYDSKELFRAKDDIQTYIEILAMRTPEELKMIIEEFPKIQKAPGKSLEDRIKDKFKDPVVKEIMLSLLKGERHPEDKTPSFEEIKTLGKEVAKMEKFTWEVNNPFYNAVMKLNSKELFIFCCYFKAFYGNVLPSFKALSEERYMTFFKALENNFGNESPAFEALHDLIYAVVSPSEYCAEQFIESMDGFGVDDDKLIRLVITRREKDLPTIKKYYKQKYCKDLIKLIEDECSGNYKEILTALCDV